MTDTTLEAEIIVAKIPERRVENIAALKAGVQRIRQLPEDAQAAAYTTLLGESKLTGNNITLLGEALQQAAQSEGEKPTYARAEYDKQMARLRTMKASATSRRQDAEVFGAVGVQMDATGGVRSVNFETYHPQGDHKGLQRRMQSVPYGPKQNRSSFKRNQ